jgi:hypothetical protein
MNELMKTTISLETPSEMEEDAYIKVVKVCTQDEQKMQELFSLLRFLVCDED